MYCKGLKHVACAFKHAGLNAGMDGRTHECIITGHLIPHFSQDPVFALQMRTFVISGTIAQWYYSPADERARQVWGW